MTDIARAIGALWRAATPADKAPYEAKAAEDKLRYQREIDALPEEERPKPKPRKRKPAAPKKPPKEKPPPKRPRKPKQPAGRPKPKGALSAYMFFVKAKRASVLADHPEMAGSVTEAAKATGALWRALSDAEKEPYATLAAEDKARHVREMATYQASTGAASGAASGATSLSGASSSASASISGGSGPPAAAMGGGRALMLPPAIVPAAGAVWRAPMGGRRKRCVPTRGGFDLGSAAVKRNHNMLWRVVRLCVVWCLQSGGGRGGTYLELHPWIRRVRSDCDGAERWHKQEDLGGRSETACTAAY